MQTMSMTELPNLTIHSMKSADLAFAAACTAAEGWADEDIDTLWGSTCMMPGVVLLPAWMVRQPA